MNNGRTEILRFETNQPEMLSLAFDDGLPVEGRFGDQLLYTVRLADGSERQMYVPPIVAHEFEIYGIKKGEPIQLGKFEVKRGNRRGIEWRVERVKKDAPPPAPEPRPEATVMPGPAAKQAEASAPPTKAEYALKTAIAAWANAQEFAHERHFQMPPVTSEDIRSIAITLLINDARSGAK